MKTIRKTLQLERLEARSMLATFIVTNLGDGNVGQSGDAPGTLRQAIFDANALPGPDVIMFALDVRGTLNRDGRPPPFYIYDSLEIQGPGTDQLTVANASFRVRGEPIEFTISGLNLVGSLPSCGPGTNCAEPVIIHSNGSSLTIVNVTMSNGPSFGVDFGDGELTMKNSSVVGMHWTGILFDGGRSFIENSIIRNNGDRGMLLGSGTHIIKNSEISENVSITSAGGAGIRFSGDLTIDNSLLANNSTPRGRGGAIHASGALTIRNSTVSGNFAKFTGGGIYQRSGDTSVQGVTITNNRTSTVSANAGGGIYHREGQLTVLNSIVARNNPQRVREPAARDIRLSSGSFVVENSLISDVTGTNLTESHSPDNNGNLLGGPFLGLMDPRLGPLTYNGGRAQVHQLLRDSPAVDAAMDRDDVGEFDQRGEGFARVFNGVPDMGAFELQSIPGDFDGDYSVGCDEVDQLAEAILENGNSDAMFDLTEDNIVDSQDMDALLDSIATHRLHSRQQVLPADANLDGVVDGSDFNIWNRHRSTEASGICQGDFNLDGIVDGTDWSIWSEIKFQSIGDGPQENGVAVPAEAPAPFGRLGLGPPWRHKLSRRVTVNPDVAVQNVGYETSPANQLSDSPFVADLYQPTVGRTAYTE